MELATLPHYAGGSGLLSSLSGTPERTESYMGLIFTFYAFYKFVSNIYYTMARVLGCCAEHRWF